MLFNVGALYTQIGARQDRSAAAGIDKAIDAFQRAAGSPKHAHTHTQTWHAHTNYYRNTTTRGPGEEIPVPEILHINTPQLEFRHNCRSYISYATVIFSLYEYFFFCVFSIFLYKTVNYKSV